MRLFGIIGYPLEHSFSAKHFTEKFIHEGLNDHSYRAFPLTSVDLLPQLLHDEPELCGFNVTIPYKVAVMKYLHSLDPAAEAIGAVNTVKVIHEGDQVVLKGFNTDAPAFRITVEKNFGSPVTTALVLGSGGASAAIVYELENMGVIVSKVSRLSGKGNLTYDEITPEILHNTDMIVNTTPLGMYPDIESCPGIDYKYLDSHHILYDVVYNPEKTEFLKRGEKQGCKIKNGLEMLHLQADFAWKIWNNSDSK